MSNKSFSFMDLIGLPEEQNRVMLYLVDNGAQSLEQLSNALKTTVEELEPILAILLKEGYVSKTDSNSYQANMGQRTSNTSSDEKKDSSFMDGLLDSLIDIDE